MLLLDLLDSETSAVTKATMSTLKAIAEDLTDPARATAPNVYPSCPSCRLEPPLTSVVTAKLDVGVADTTHRLEMEARKRIRFTKVLENEGNRFDGGAELWCSEHRCPEALMVKSCKREHRDKC